MRRFKKVRNQYVSVAMTRDTNAKVTIELEITQPSANQTRTQYESVEVEGEPSSLLVKHVEEEHSPIADLVRDIDD